jgi:sugar-specific transcriptional regulator TrmB
MIESMKKILKFLNDLKNILFFFYHYFLKRRMEKVEILHILQSLGLSDYESKVYFSLVLLGPAKASEISKQAEVPRAKIYEVLESLIEKQLAEVSQERPKLFKAIEPEIAVKAMVSKREEELKVLKQKAKDLMKEFHALPREKELVEGIWEQNGEKAIDVLNKLAEMIKRAKNYAIFITRDFSTSPILKESIKDCLKRNVRLKLICMGLNKENFYRAKWYIDQKIPIRVFETKVHPRILVVDGKEVAMRLDKNPLAKRFEFKSIWSSDPSFVSMMDNYLKNLWKMAKPINLKNFNSLTEF